MSFDHQPGIRYLSPMTILKILLPILLIIGWQPASKGQKPLALKSKADTIGLLCHTWEGTSAELAGKKIGMPSDPMIYRFERTDSLTQTLNKESAKGNWKYNEGKIRYKLTIAGAEEIILIIKSISAQELQLAGPTPDGDLVITFVRKD